ncbi:MAG: MFS transporter, partial [Chloroflexi bacterium]|nr:MFS transporter [Chloroflexota bacterium]
MLSIERCSATSTGIEPNGAPPKPSRVTITPVEPISVLSSGFIVSSSRLYSPYGNATALIITGALRGETAMHLTSVPSAIIALSNRARRMGKGQGNLLRPSTLLELRNAPHLAALKYRDYRVTWTANMFSGAAMWTFIVASQWFTLSESDSSGWVGILTFASMIPFLIVSLPGGIMADRIDRRTLAQIMLFASFVVTAILAVLVISGEVKLWHVAVLAFLGGAFRAVQEPTVTALIPNQVPQSVLLNAITLNAATRHGARFFGLLIAAPLMAIPSIGVAGVLVLSALFAGASTLMMSLVKTVSSGEGRTGQGMIGGILHDMGDGLAYIYKDKAIALFMVLVALHCALVMSFESILPIFSRESLGAGDGSILGYLVMAFGAGSLVGILLLAGVRSEKLKGQLLISV